MKKQIISIRKNAGECGYLADTIAEYERGIALLRGRIEEFNAQLGTAQGGYRQELIERRRLLYDEVVDMRYAAREMNEYLQVLLQREDNAVPVAKGA